MADTEDRLSTLRWLYDVTRESIESTPPHQRSPLISNMRAIAQEIAELGGDEQAQPERTGLLDFQEALAKRQSDAPGSRRTAR